MSRREALKQVEQSIADLDIESCRDYAAKDAVDGVKMCKLWTKYRRRHLLDDG